jgi:uncharacterized protein (TIGR04141 family)
MSKTVNAKLYRIHESIIDDRDNNEELIGEIITNYHSKSGNEFIEVKLIEELEGAGMKAKLFVFSTKNKPAYWQEFLSGIAESQEDLEILKTQYSSFVLFLYDHEIIYATSKGYYGHFLLEEYIDEFFGLEVLSRLINKSTTEIRRIEERGVFGIEVGAMRFFRENFNLASDDDFGKIYKTMLASFDEEDFGKLGVTQKKSNIKKLLITGSGSLEISSKFSFKELINRVLKIRDLLKTEGVEFNQFYRVPSAQLNPIKNKLNDSLLQNAYKAYTDETTIDFYSPNVLDYLRSTEVQFIDSSGITYEVQYCSSKKYVEIIKELVDNLIIDATDEETFTMSLQQSYGQYRYNEDSPYSAEISLDNWVCGETELDDKKYFKLDGTWYLYRDTLDIYLNNFFESYPFSDLCPPTSLEPWISKSEGKYNEEYKLKEGYIVTDRSYLKHIEMADLIKIDDDAIYLYHVKRGLGQDTRALINQIANAARLLTYHKDEPDNTGLKLYYKSIINKHYGGLEIEFKAEGKTVSMSEEDFINLFKSGKKFKFVFAYGSNSSEEIKNEIIKSESRIAKLSLIYIIRDIRRTDFQILFERIKTD